MGPFIVLGVGLLTAGVVFFIQFKKIQQEHGKSQTGSSPGQAKTKVGSQGPKMVGKGMDVKTRMQHAERAQDFLGFESIDGNVVKLDANRYVAYVAVQPVNFYLMTGLEQAALEDAFRAFLDSCRFRFQICISSVPLDLSEHFDALKASLADLPPHLQAYGQELGWFEEQWIRAYAPITKKYVIVIPYEFAQNPKRPVEEEIVEQQAHQELELRCSQVIEGLAMAKLTATRMEYGEIVSYLYQIFHRHEGAALAGRNLQEENYHSLYVTSTNQVQAIEALDEEAERAIHNLEGVVGRAV